MTLPEVLSILRRRWPLVVLGVIVAIALALPARYTVDYGALSVKQKSSASGAARAVLYADYNVSAIAFAPVGAESLENAAQVVARLTDSGDVRRDVAKRLNIPVQDISVEGPYPNSPLDLSQQPSAQQRANQILGEQRAYSIYITTDARQPTITLFTQAPTGRAAIRLADTTAASLTDAVQRSAASRRSLDEAFSDRVAADEAKLDRKLAPAEKRSLRRSFYPQAIVVRRAGDATGGDVSSQAGSLLMIVEFLAAFSLWCLLVVLASRVTMRSRLRKAAAREEQEERERIAAG